LLAIANKIYIFSDTHDGNIKESALLIVDHMNKAIQQIPHLRNFKVGQKTIIKDNKI
jgi:hypothetical protein